MTEQDQTEYYLTNCFVGRKINGVEIILSGIGTMVDLTVHAARTEFDNGPIGDEMWARLTMGLPRKEIA